MSRVSAVTASVLGAATVAATIAWGPQQAAAAPGSATPVSNCGGVVVIVDYGALGGVDRGCAAGDPASGLEALALAGFSYDFVPGKGPLVCKIDNRPDPCNGAPQNEHWAYYHADPGGSWQYTNVGAHIYDPEPGEVEGWAFGAGGAPGVAPPAAAPATTTTVPPPTTRPPAVAPPPSPAPAGAEASTTTTPPPATTTSVTTRASTSTSTVTSTSTSRRSAGTGGDSGAVRAADVSPAAHDDGNGAPIGFFAGSGAILGLGAATLAQVRRRRRDEEP